MPYSTTLEVAGSAKKAADLGWINLGDAVRTQLVQFGVAVTIGQKPTLMVHPASSLAS